MEILFSFSVFSSLPQIYSFPFPSFSLHWKSTIFGWWLKHELFYVAHVPLDDALRRLYSRDVKGERYTVHGSHFVWIGWEDRGKVIICWVAVSVLHSTLGSRSGRKLDFLKDVWKWIMPIIVPGNPVNNSDSYFPVSYDGLGGSTSIVSDKFQSIFEPWGDYVFGTIMIIIGKLYLP